MTEENEKTPEQLFEEVLMDKNGISLMDLLCHPDLSEFVKTFDDVELPLKVEEK
jgi:hypothetical protein